MQSKYLSSSSALIEALESRRFLSASPLSIGAGLLVDKAASHSHAHVGVPVLTGAPFVGTSSSNTGDQPSGLQLTIASETKSGGLVGTLLVDVGSGKQKAYAVKGSVNHLGMFVIHATGPNHSNALIKGNASADGKTVSGTYAAHEPGKHPSNGTFTMSR